MEAVLISGGVPWNYHYSKNAWKIQHNQPPNSTLGGIHMTQNTYDFVEWANPIKNSQK
jgi:hypothetical protein